MKLVKEHINEKFTEDSDPVADMGIGVTSPHTFTDVNEFIDYLVDAVIPYIYGGKIPNNILDYKAGGPGSIPHKLFNNLINFFKKYNYKSKGKMEYDDFSSSDGVAPTFEYWPEILKNKLKSKGYKPIF
jgi:hypothetical protein